MMRTRAAVLVVAAALAACAGAGTARADGDPASDYLLAQRIFFPFDAKIPADKQRELSALVDRANEAGFKIRIALIWSSYDLGAITSLWGKPRTYARFLGQELEFVYKQRLLIVMPSGFGFYWRNHPVDREYGALASVHIGDGVTGLVDAAAAAVHKLAAQASVTLPAATADASSSSGHGQAHRTAVIVLAAIAGVALLVLLRLALRRSP